MKYKILLIAIVMCTLINTLDNARTRVKQRALNQRLDGIYLLLWDQDKAIMELKEEAFIDSMQDKF